MTSATQTDDAMTIDELARRAGLPVRTIREYHSMRVLPPPQRQGRIGLYDAGHVQRLELVARLQHRGYSLAGIRDLLDAWDNGTELTTLLGVDSGPVALDETPMRLTRGELFSRLPGLDGATLRRAQEARLVRPDGPSHFLVRSPALIDLAADSVRLGLSLTDVLEVISELTTGLDATAAAFARSFVQRIWQPVTSSDSATELPGYLARGRVLVLQGVASVLADRLTAALLHQAEEIPGGTQLRAAISRLSTGAMRDSAGSLQRRSTS
ncbi:MAG TPA: MerR family transcriptional regulator [Streptosporangiaceae bacterium]